jgi:hypothetical protein
METAMKARTLNHADVKSADVNTQTAVTDSAVVAAITTDQYKGQGGSYTYDPQTGKRSKNEDVKED